MVERKERHAAVEVCHHKRRIAGDHVIVRGKGFGDPPTLPQRVAKVGPQVVREVIIFVMCFQSGPVVIFRGQEQVMICKSWRGKVVWRVQVSQRALRVAEIVLGACYGEETRQSARDSPLVG